MIHTAELITKIKYNDYHFLLQQKNVKIDNFQNVYLHALNCIGITTIQAYPQKIENGYIFWCKIIINLNRVANSGKQTPFPFVVNDNNIYKLKENFSKFVKELLPHHSNIFYWSVQRIDYTIDIKTPNVKEYIKLLQRGDKPPFYKIDNEKQHKKEIDKTHYPNGVRYKNKSATINIYDKYEERKEKAKYKGELLEKCKDILRLEIQCFKRKTITLKRKFKNKENGLKIFLISEEQQRKLFKYYLSHICGKANYYEYAKALKRIEESNLHDKTKKALKEILLAVAKTKSVWKTKLILKPQKYRNYFQKLEKLNINPATIPRRWGKTELINIYRLIE